MEETTPQSLQKRVFVVRSITAVVALILIVVLVLIYTNKDDERSPNQKSMIASFYATILESTQSFFAPNRAILKE